AIRSITLERGLDPREFALVAYGGGGGLFAASIATDLGVDTVLIPDAAANFSAWGLLSSDFREDATRTQVRRVTVGTAPQIAADLLVLQRSVIDRVAAFGFSPGDLVVEHALDMRYVGQ